jgi:hypothetical protein
MSLKCVFLPLISVEKLMDIRIDLDDFGGGDETNVYISNSSDEGKFFITIVDMDKKEICAELSIDEVRHALRKLALK